VGVIGLSPRCAWLDCLGGFYIRKTRNAVKQKIARLAFFIRGAFFSALA